ncbi:methyltransferase [Kineococcus gynurae]|uniref:Methyltransferase n=1 Tax=Kineococcus gynurae TaxID=452979 RepID=A0ABV5LUB7_9ACTN
MAKERSRSRTSTALWAGVRRLLDAGGPGPQTVVDLGGGTGGLAVRVAELGHLVVVVDPSPDALAALERRAREAGVSDRIRAVQGDAAELPAVLAPGGPAAADLAGVWPAAGADLLLAHGVLEVVDDPAAALAAAHAVLRPGGRLSLLLTQWSGTVLSRALAGNLAQALRTVTDPEHRGGDHDLLRRRFDRAGATGLAAAAGFTVTAVEGVRIFADLVPAACGASEAEQAQLLALEEAAARHEEFLGVAGQLHLHAHR